ncbi:hypothetical protein [Halomonas rhizosphaerae]|uniref:Uncharacterized protein n=1 Tax=Halomonas rhizosphaerae TaxID=3043296 RepID=A0ABT6UYP8_9GAMM|nr:hypothetical protein [Halomonas rhizosphaerae]MDI5891089.1 hypothetical protein [Halomonas rhizosphaerae]
MKQGKEPTLQMLKEGTLVKHGTTSRSLQGIIDQGIRPRAHNYYYRSVVEQTPVAEQAVYVGKNMAYCAAMLSFMDLVMADEIKPSPKKKSAIPIVLNIRLGDDCLVVADEDFVLLDQYDQHGNVRLTQKYIDELTTSVREEGIRTWEEYGTVGVVRPDGIPAAWIESFEHPRLKLETSPDIFSDIELMLLGYRQQQDGLSLKEISGKIHEFDIQGESFSQRHILTPEGVEAYKSQETLKNIHERQRYCRELRRALFNLGTQKHGLPFH